MTLPKIQKTFLVSIFLFSLTGCYSSDVITVDEFKQIEASDKPDEIRVTTKDSTVYHFTKPDYYVKNDTLFGKKKIVLNENESFITKKIALSDIKHIQTEMKGWLGKKIPTTLPQGKNIPSEKNHLYFELLGNGIIYTINYERFVSENFVFRAGFGFTPILGKQVYIGIPLTVSYLIGSGPLKFELGFGTTFILKEKNKFFRLPEEEETFFLLTGIIGLRIFKPEGGLYFKVTLTPFYSEKFSQNKFRIWGGISFGYGF